MTKEFLILVVVCTTLASVAFGQTEAQQQSKDNADEAQEMCGSSKPSALDLGTQGDGEKAEALDSRFICVVLGATGAQLQPGDDDLSEGDADHTDGAAEYGLGLSKAVLGDQHWDLAVVQWGGSRLLPLLGITIWQRPNMHKEVTSFVRLASDFSDGLGWYSSALSRFDTLQQQL